MNTKTLALCLLLGLVASGCARREADDDAIAEETGIPAAQEQAPAPPKEVAALKVEVTLSPAAEQKLKASGESVRVEVVYGGDPAPEATLTPNELGMIELGKKVFELDGSGVVEVPESAVDRSRLDQIVGQPQVMVNTTSGRKSTPENLLACAFYWDTLGTAGHDGIAVPCKLLTEAKGG
ncbi:hypothetical protein B1992_06890 [Pseudoxanthomonas broegbernensis]|uniref:Lipoprotein n=1 Tax=Pseudoxanthomonas broegbernensis TaxID=83619 RepID=A0A7V8K7A3_9GAMM|nr:hypothetical protein [Pseudoxanthomonas broegbernensis]KAF1686630.1 hypothetical protein B1992_06890 [Pseudoxanthomonas broegbernensis]MBB6063616.1 hypothetical protein [Pseudoxanthomonas broegbernensis]